MRDVLLTLRKVPDEVLEAVEDLLDESGVVYREDDIRFIKKRGRNLYVVPGIDDGVEGQVRRTDPDTSRNAAKMNIGSKTSIRARVFMAIGRAGDYGMTATELELETGIDWRSMTPRVGELKNWGYVTTNGKTRKGDRGADQVICVLTLKGLEEFSKRLAG